MPDFATLLLLSGLLVSLYYGVVWCFKPESDVRTFVKTVPLLLLAGASVVAGAPILLTAALLLSAAGDAFLARSGEGRFMAGLASFLLAHLAYCWLFATLWSGANTQTSVLVAAIGVMLLATLVLRHLWQHLETMKLPVILYTMAIGGMAITGFGASVGGVLLIGVPMFLASDILLAHQQFVMDIEHRLQNLVSGFIWYLYSIGQVLITGAVTIWV